MTLYPNFALGRGPEKNLRVASKEVNYFPESVWRGSGSGFANRNMST